jgi:hypothetical protein
MIVAGFTKEEANYHAKRMVIWCHLKKLDIMPTDSNKSYITPSSQTVKNKFAASSFLQ